MSLGSARLILGVVFFVCCFANRADAIFDRVFRNHNNNHNESNCQYEKSQAESNKNNSAALVQKLSLKRNQLSSELRESGDAISLRVGRAVAHILHLDDNFKSWIEEEEALASLEQKFQDEAKTFNDHFSKVQTLQDNLVNDIQNILKNTEYNKNQRARILTWATLLDRSSVGSSSETSKVMRQFVSIIDEFINSLPNESDPPNKPSNQVHNKHDQTTLSTFIAENSASVRETSDNFLKQALFYAWRMLAPEN